MPMYWTFNCFRLHIYSILYSIYSILSSKLTFKSWISTSEKRGPSCPNWGHGGGGGLGNSGNARKKTFFFRWPLPLLTSNSSESTFLNFLSRSSFFSFCSSRSTRVSFISPFQTKSCQFIKDNVLTICFLGFLFPLGHISLLLIHLLICLVQLKCVNF